jgi:hypothetical protein
VNITGKLVIINNGDDYTVHATKIEIRKSNNRGINSTTTITTEIVTDNIDEKFKEDIIKVFKFYYGNDLVIEYVGCEVSD